MRKQFDQIKDKLTQIASLVMVFLSPGTLTGQSLPNWFSNHSVDLNADLSLRSDHIYNLVDRDDIHRARLWLRPGFEVSPAGWLRFGARGSFALGTDRNEQSILRFDNFHSNDVALDRLYVAMEKGGIELRAGKFDMPFQVSEMFWDHDIQPSGAFAAYHRGWFTLRGGLFNRSHIHHDRSTVTGGQLTLRRNVTTHWTGEADMGFFAFNALNQFQSGMGRQNRVRLIDGHLEYQSAFRLANGRFRFDYQGFTRWPLAVESSYIHNFGTAHERRAIEALAEVGQVERRGDWRFSYSFQRVERDAVVGAFTSDDWWFHSDHQGSRLTAAVSVLPHTFLQFGAVLQKRHHTVDWVKRFQIDLVTRF